MAITVTDETIRLADNVAVKFCRTHSFRPIGDREDVRQQSRLIVCKFFATLQQPPPTFLLISHITRRLIDELRRVTHYHASNRPEFVVSSDVAMESAERVYLNLDPIFTADFFDVLSARLNDKERVVCWLLRKGLTQAEVARRLCVYRSTITRRIERIVAKAREMEGIEAPEKE